MPIVAGYDANPSDNLRVELAFTTGPDDPNPAWQDVTGRFDLVAGCSITRGRGDEFSVVQPSSCQLTFNNYDGALTAGNPGSTFYPNVKPYRKVRVTYRNPDVGGNFVDEASASLETSIGSWTAVGATTVARDTLHAADGSYSLKITWAVTASVSKAACPVTGLVIGRSYRLSAVSFVPTGGEVVSLNIDGIGLGTSSTVTNAPEVLSTTFTATANAHTINLYQFSVGTGYSSWVDAIRVDEVGTPTTFTTDAPPINYRFTGNVEEWPTEWSGLYAQAPITATDRFARIGAKRAMRSVIEEAVLTLAPRAYYPMGEPEGASLAGDVSGVTGSMPLSITQIGALGTLEFGTATGPPTDALPAPTFTPVSSSAGKFLSGNIAGVGGITSVSLRANFLTSVTARATIVRIRDAYNSYLELEVTAAGKLRAHLWSPFAAADTFTITSANNVDNGATHDACVVMSLAGGTVTCTLYLDGASAGSTSFSAPLLKVFTQIRVGGNSDGNLFTGTISHVAVFGSAVSAADVLEVFTATSTGFEGDSSDERIARYARWAGIDVSEMVLDAGSSQSICFTDTTGLSVLQAMQDVAQTEGGRLFIDGAGRLVFHSRARGYANPAASASVDASLLGADTRLVESTQGLVNDLTAQRPTGPNIRAFDADSREEFGVHDPGGLTLLVTSDAEVLDAVNWRVQNNAVPEQTIPQGSFDLFTDSTGYQAQLRGLELGDRVTMTGLPSQVGAAGMDFVLEGYSESISVGGWSLTANLSNYSAVQALTLDDAVYGLIDSDNRLIY